MDNTKEQRIKLKAVNSGQDMEFFIQSGEIDGETEFYFTLCGIYLGEENMQVDFDCLNPKQFRQFIAKCYKLLKDTEVEDV